MKTKKQQEIKSVDHEVLEAIRLINKFFPESAGFVSPERGISIWYFVDAMRLGEFQADFSCESFDISMGLDLGLNKKGGFNGNNRTVFERLLAHTGYCISGRCVIIPDAVSLKNVSQASFKPVFCNYKMVGQRISELDCLFDGAHDSLFVFETGEALAIDHDNRFYWAKSKRKKRNRYRNVSVQTGSST